MAVTIGAAVGVGRDAASPGGVHRSAFDEYITAVANSGFAGVLWSPEVRGGNGTASSELPRDPYAIRRAPEVTWRFMGDRR